MLELEVKVLNVDLDDMETRLKELGAKLVSDEEQTNIIFDSSNGYIEKELDGYLRIRETVKKSGNKIKMTYKKSLPNQELRENLELSLELKDQEAKENMIRILGELGYREKSTGYKHRKSYIYDGIRFDLDCWDQATYPHPYMEIELEDPKDLDRAIELLKIDRKQISTESILQLQNKLV